MRRVAARVAAALVAGAVAVAFYGTVIEPRLMLDRRHYDIEMPRLPPALDGMEIAVFSDLQVGMRLANTGMIRRIVAEAVESRPAAVVVAGDFVYGRSPDIPVQVRTVIELLRPLLGSGIPVYAVLGNHDYASGAAAELSDALQREGVRVLRNEAAQVPGTDRAQPPMFVAGIDAYIPGRSRPDAALDGVPDDAPRFVVMHNPESFTAIGAHEAPLAVAGHTHCGQIAIPGLPTWSYLELMVDERIAVDGFAPPDYGADGNRLFVTCGIGFSRLPIRIASPPQLVTFELQARGVQRGQ